MKTAARMVCGVAGALFLAQGTPNQAAATESASVDFLACAAERDDARRLACFDAAVAQARGQPAGSRSAAAAPVPIPPPLSKEEKFGLRGDLKQEKARQVPELAELKELQAKVTKVATKPHGELVLTLDSGQVWTEIQTNSGARVKAGDQVTIKAGALGSFLLVAPNGRSSKVTRVR